MPAFRRLASTSRACVVSAVATTLVGGLVAGLVGAPPAAADPCSVPTPNASARGLTPSMPDIISKLPVLHLPIGRKPVQTASTPEEAKDTAVAPNTAARAAAEPAASTATTVGWVTGPNSDSYSRFGISGADLGIMWDNGQTGANRQVLIAFGDTFGNCNVAAQEWRKNTLFRSADRNLADGMSIPNPVPGNIYAGSPWTPHGPTSPGR